MLTFKPTLENGWNLTAFDSTVDTKIPETINALAGMMEKAGAIAAPVPAKAGARPVNNFGPGLYRLTFDRAHGGLVSVEPVFQMKDADGHVIACPQPGTSGGGDPKKSGG